MVTSKTSRRIPSRLTVPSQREESTSDEAIKSDEEPGKSTDEASIHLSSVSSEGSNVEYLKSTPVKEANIVRVNQKLDLNERQILRALGTFTMHKQFNVESINQREPSSIEASQASRITDSAQDINSNVNINNDGPKPSRVRPKKELKVFTMKTGLDADPGDNENRLITRSRGKALASQQSRQPSVEIVVDRKERGNGFVSQSQAPSGSSIAINRLKK